MDDLIDFKSPSEGMREEDSLSGLSSSSLISQSDQVVEERVMGLPRLQHQHVEAPPLLKILYNDAPFYFEFTAGGEQVWEQVRGRLGSNVQIALLNGTVIKDLSDSCHDDGSKSDWVPASAITNLLAIDLSKEVLPASSGRRESLAQASGAVKDKETIITGQPTPLHNPSNTNNSSKAPPTGRGNFQTRPNCCCC